VLFRAIDQVVEAGITDLGIVVGDTAPDIEAAVGNGSRWGARVTYIHQEAPLGLAHAVKVSEKFIDGERFVMFLGDNVIQGGVRHLVDQFSSNSWDAQIVLTRVQNPEQLGVAIFDDEGHIERLVEKPKEPVSDLALVGIYMFGDRIFEAVRAITPSWRGELEITDAIQFLLDRGHAVHPYIHTGWWIDTGKMEDMLDANRLVLDELEPRVEGVVDGSSTLRGKVTVERGARITNSVIRGPAIVGEDTLVEDSYVGPFTSIHHHAEILSSEIEHSIVMEYSRIIAIDQRIEDSLIGRNVEITRSPVKPKAYKLILGDYSKVGIISNGR
jgi:glucose-1-phosphate thymidylyltransferase